MLTLGSCHSDRDSLIFLFHIRTSYSEDFHQFIFNVFGYKFDRRHKTQVNKYPVCQKILDLDHSKDF